MMQIQVTHQTEQQFHRKKTVFRTYQAVWYILGVIEVILAFRVLLKLLGANPGSGFAAFIYSISGPFAIPFLAVVPASRAGSSIIEWSTLIAMAVYLVIAFGIIKLMQFAKPVTPEEVDKTIDTEV